MAFSANTVWEVRTTGSDSNGGGFVVGSGGTDYSLQDSAQATGTVTSVTTTVTATTGIFTAAMIGNYITDGTTWKQITGYTSSTIITVDSAPSWTAASIKVGGAFATIGRATGKWVTGNRIWVKSGTYAEAVTISISEGDVTGSSGADHLIGYYSARGDITTTANLANRPVISVSSSSTGITISSAAYRLENIIVNCNSNATTTGISVSANYGLIRNCKVLNATVRGIYVSSAANPGHNLQHIEVTGCTAAATAALQILGYGCTITLSNIHDNACPGITLTGGCSLTWSIIANNTGASSDGVKVSEGNLVQNNTIYGNGRHGIYTADQYAIAFCLKNNIIAKNGGYGFSQTSAYPDLPDYDGNAYWSNTSGARLTGSTSAPWTGPFYTNVLDVLVTAGSPFTNDGSGDFSLNNTANRGALLRGTAYPGAIPGISQTGSLDFGAIQAAAPGGMLVHPGMQGGCRG